MEPKVPKVEPVRVPARDEGGAASHLPTGSFNVEATPSLGSDTPPASSARMPTQIGTHDILEEIAVGGMGIVYKARRHNDGLIVALKMMRPESAGSTEQAQRFHREILAAARLHHDHIVPILDVGWHEGKPFYTMPFCPGNLKQLKNLAGDVKAIVALMEKVARGIQHAHEQDVLHRDLKPGNILIDERGEPAVSDFGLAKLHDADLELTQTGAVIGTWPYMSPEQADGRTRDLGPPTDVWALGVMLYELLAGQRPFIGADVNELREKILKATPAPMRKLRPDVPADLETIVARCLQKKPARRYVSAGALADDLRRWQCCERVTKPSSWRWAAALVALVAVVAFVAIGLAAYLMWDREPWGLPNPPNNPPVPFELIGETGPPMAGKLLAGQKDSVVISKPGELFSIETKNIMLWELVEKPASLRYQLEAEIRIDDSPDGSAGLYLGHRDVANTQYFWNFCFIEEGRAAGAVFLGLRKFTQTSGIGSLAVNGPRTFFKPTGPKFHQLKVNVCEDWIEVQFDENSFGKITKQDFDEKKADLNLGFQDPEFCPRGSLGFFTQRGRSSFRNCRLSYPLER